MSKAEHMNVSPSRVSYRVKNYSYTKQSVPGQMQEFTVECKDKDSRLLEQKHQPGKDYLQNKTGDSSSVLISVGFNETSTAAAEVYPRNLRTKDLVALPEDLSGHCLGDDILNLKQATLDQKFNYDRRIADAELDAVHEPKGLSTERDSFGSYDGLEKSRDTSGAPSIVKPTLSILHVDVTKNLFSEGLDFPPGFPIGTEVKRSSYNEETVLNQMPKLSSNSIGQETADGSQNTGYRSVENGPAIVSPGLPNSTVGKSLELPHHSSSRLGCKNKRATSQSRKKYMLRSQVASDKVLRSSSRQKKKETDDKGSDVTKASIERRNRKGRKKSRNDVTVDEYSRIRSHLRYLVNRMNYEKSLITAYSAEGWKGLSLEKLKPEKELQRATSEILRLKLRIRDLFQHINALCAAGRLPESLFDSEGQIGSEDIFCAKCGSKDLTLDNDIILCDGACDRGFHQFCLVPPMLKEDIPPDDQGWLCPGCDCKVDCIDFLNESQGTKLSLNDRWEKVFPEAAAAAAANLDREFELPEDDSEDNDYNPEGSDTDNKSWGDESSSDESDFTSASDELVGPSHDQQVMGLPSDDSDDNDYDPNAHDLEAEVNPENSSSDFTSDSEDLDAVMDGSAAAAVVGHCDGGNQGRTEGNREKDHTFCGNMLCDLDQDPGEDGSTPVSGKRNVERLDYKKLYDETYGNDPYDSSEDEDFTDVKCARKRRKKSGEAALAFGSENDLSTDDELGAKDMKQQQEDVEHARRRKNQTPKLEDENTSSAGVPISPYLSSPGCRRVKSSSYRRLGEVVTQRLYQSFKENQYPDRAMKEDLAKELGISINQVSKWFGNARWSFNHSPPVDASTTTGISKKDSLTTCTTNKKLELASNTVSRDVNPGGTRPGEYPTAAAASTFGKCSEASGNTPESGAIKRDSTDQGKDKDIVSGLPASGWTKRSK